MDAAGARALHWRLEEQRHWEQAGSVQQGRAPARDPDGGRLTGLGEGVRLYGRFQKRLVGDAWRFQPTASDVARPVAGA